MAYDTVELVNSFTASGLSKEEFCKQQTISLSALRYHLTKHRKQKDGCIPPSSSGHFISLNPKKDHHTTTMIMVQGDFDRDDIAHILKAVTLG